MKSPNRLMLDLDIISELLITVLGWRMIPEMEGRSDAPESLH